MSRKHVSVSELPSGASGATAAPAAFAASPAAATPSVARIVESVIGCKWSVQLLGLCAAGHSRPSALLRACPGLSAKVMNERLRKMLRLGILDRTVCGDKPPVEVHYRLTPFGRRFLRIIREVQRLQEAVNAGRVRLRGDQRALSEAGSGNRRPTRRGDGTASTRRGM